MAMRRERDILAEIRKALVAAGWFVYRNHQSLGSHPGLADLTAVRDGRVVWIEVKRPGGRLSKDQEKFAEEIRRHGGRYVVASSVEEALAAVERFD
jgi:Holliday junction resolvase